MDPMDILGGLLGGGKSGGGGLGGKILSELLKGGRRSAPQPQQPKVPTGRGPRQRQVNIDQHARELEDLLGVAKDRYSGGSRGTTQVSHHQRQTEVAPPPRDTRGHDHGSHAGSGGFHTQHHNPVGRCDPLGQDDEAIVLIRSMINAAKADGRITADEQQEIVGRIPNPSQETINFLREEFSKPVDVRDFAWSIPLGMEQKVYTISLAAIDLDTNPEANYLRELAHGLRLEPDFCNQMHQQYGAPILYR